MRGFLADELQSRALALVGEDETKERLCVLAVFRIVGSPISFGSMVLVSLLFKLSKVEPERVNECGLSVCYCKAVGKSGGDDRVAIIVVDE